MALVKLLKYELRSNLGCCLSPLNASIQLSGIETLGLRVQRHCDNAIRLAQYLNDHPAVTKVHYPGLPQDAAHPTALKLFNGRYGGILTFELESREKAFRFIDHLKLSLNLSNLGDARTLVIHPASTIYSGFFPDELYRLGVKDELVRVSVGLEESRDIIADFDHALSTLKTD
jgi:O-acetylhomoserine (thiol)-lyase